MMYYYNGFSPFEFIGPILMCVVWIVVIVAVLRALRGRYPFEHSDSHYNRNTRALDILKERYAKGEITKEEFESMKKDLQ